MSSAIQASIIVCVYNGASRIVPLFTHLAALTDELAKELVVVNNASTDTTAEVVLEQFKECSNFVKCRLVDELEPGLSNARKKGVETAVGEILIFCDDDNWLYPDYVAVAYQRFHQNPNIGVLGAVCHATALVPLPDWFKDYEWAFACGALYDNFTITTGSRAVWGAGLSMRRKMVDIIFNNGHPFLYSDRLGNTLSGGGDNEICYRSWLLGYDSCFVPNLQLRHCMSPERLNLTYLHNLLMSFNDAAAIKSAYFRMFQVSKLGAFQKSWLGCKQAIAFCMCKLGISNINANHAQEYLFFLTGLPFLASDVSRSIRAFYVYAKSINAIN